MKKFDINAEYQVDVSDLAYLAGLTERRIQQLEVEGVVIKLAHGKYDLIECVRAIVEHTRASSRGSVASEAEKNERTRLTREKRKIAEMNRRELAGDLVRVEVQRRNLYEVGREVKNNLETMPDRLAGLLAGENDKGACYSIMAAEIRTTLESLVEKLAGTLVEDPRAYVEIEQD